MTGVDSLTDEQIEILRELLRSRCDDVQKALSAAKDDARPVQLDAPIGRLTRVDALQQQHMATARRQRLETELTQLHQALGKLRVGTYGECVRCGESIGYARLSVRPEAPFCVPCQGGSET